MVPAHPSGMLSTREAATMAGISPKTLRDWRRKGFLAPQGLDERGYPLHTPEAVGAAEELVRQHGIDHTGIDPRQLRQRPPLAA